MCARLTKRLRQARRRWRNSVGCVPLPDRHGRWCRSYDLGLYSPHCTDLAGHSEYCGLFRTPTLRNVALKKCAMQTGLTLLLQFTKPKFTNFKTKRIQLLHGISNH